MESRPRSLPVRLLSGFWRGVDESRRFAVNVLFLVLVVVLVGAVFTGKPKVPKGGALVVRLKGVLVEQLTGRNFRGFLEDATGDAR